jgi:hypothetical protein
MYVWGERSIMCYRCCKNSNIEIFCCLNFFMYIHHSYECLNPACTIFCLKIFKIKNSVTWKNYTTAREKIFNDTGRASFVNERRLFHGSKYAEEIARHGFLDTKSRAGMLA